MTVKRVPKKKKLGDVILVDEQILRWRRAMAKKDAVLGRQSERARRNNARARAVRAEKRDLERAVSTETVTKKKWF